MLEAGAGINEQSDLEHTALHVAVSRNAQHLVQHLVTHGADIDISSLDGETPLTKSSWLGYEPLVKILLDHGANSSVVNTNLLTPLLATTSRGHTAIVRELLDHRADPDLHHGPVTPLHSATKEWFLDIIRLLLRAGADVWYNQYHTISDLIIAGAEKEAILETGDTELSFAVLKGHFGTNLRLLEHGPMLTRGMTKARHHSTTQSNDHHFP